MKGYISRPDPLGLCACALALTLLLSTPATAGIEQGYDAFDRGDVVGAVQIWRSLAEQGNATAQFNLGQLYRLGNGVKADDREALKWYLLAAEGGMVSAQYNLILMYEEGRISPEDIAPLLASANNRLQQLPPDDYLLQIIATPNREALDRYIKANKSALQQQQLLVAAIRRDDKDWHVLFFGPFSDKESARQARDALPEALGKDNPWIRTVSSVQAAAGSGLD
jgi:TPR repeat protein